MIIVVIVVLSLLILLMTEVQTTNNGATTALTAVKSATKRPKRNLPSLPSTSSASDMTDVAYSCKVDVSPTTWESLPLHGVFSMASDGSYPYVKVSRSKACDLRTGKSIPVGSGRCYRVIF